MSAGFSRRARCASADLGSFRRPITAFVSSRYRITETTCRVRDVLAARVALQPLRQSPGRACQRWRPTKTSLRPQVRGSRHYHDVEYGLPLLESGNPWEGALPAIGRTRKSWLFP